MIRVIDNPAIPIIIPQIKVALEPSPITFIVRHIPSPKSKAATTPKVKVKILAGRFAFASSL